MQANLLILGAQITSSHTLCRFLGGLASAFALRQTSFRSQTITWNAPSTLLLIASETSARLHCLWPSHGQPCNASGDLTAMSSLSIALYRRSGKVAGSGRNASSLEADG